MRLVAIKTIIKYLKYSTADGIQSLSAQSNLMATIKLVPLSVDGVIISVFKQMNHSYVNQENVNEFSFPIKLDIIAHVSACLSCLRT